MINPQATARTPSAPQQHEPGAPPAIPQAVSGALTRHGYRTTKWCTTVFAAGLSTVLGLADWTGATAAQTVGMPARRPPEPAPPVLGLGERSRWIDLDGPVHYLDFGGPADGPTVVCVHGLAGFAVNWSTIAPLLTGRYRVLAPDLAGHGLTRSGGRGTDVAANRALLHRFIGAVAPSPTSPVILIGNSMGGMISLLEAAAAPGAVAGLVLIDPVLPLAPARPDPLVAPMLAAYAMPGLGPVLMGRRRRMSPEALVASVLALCCVDASRVPADVLAQHVAVARHRLLFTDAEQEFAAAARSIAANIGYPRGGPYRRAIRSVTCPVLLLHGARDRLVPVAIAQAAARANPAWTLAVLPGVGHLPQLEAPRDTADAITGWLGDWYGNPATAVAATTTPSAVPVAAAA